jgi:APA family basic amino acid/polyamine antiporter
VAGCILLFVSLGIYTIELFFGWAFVGLVVYFLYSRNNSQLARREQGDFNAN